MKQLQLPTRSMSRWLMTLLLVMITSLAAKAQEAYACYTPSNTTLTFYYDNLRSSRSGTTYDLNTGDDAPAWSPISSSVTSVVFDSSFADARPTTTAGWFMATMSNLKTITGMKEYLNTSEVTSMTGMFYGCNKLTSLDLSGFNTAKVTNMGIMFCNCSRLKTIYAGSGWSTAAVTTSTNMFDGCTRLVGGQGTTYDADHIDKTYAHIDGGTSNPGYLTELIPYACYTPSNTTLTFYYDSQRSSREGTTYVLNTGNKIPGWNSDGTNANVTNVVFDSSFANTRPTSTYRWFYNMKKLTAITGMKQYLNTSEVTNMEYMFYYCSALTSLDVSGFNTEGVTRMSNMFVGCSGLTSLDVGNFNTANVTAMTGMFYSCSSLTSLDVSGFNTEKVTTMQEMFMYCSSLTSLDLSGFNTQNLVYASSMIAKCSNLKSIDLTNFNTANVSHIGDMFDGCSALTVLDLSSFNTAKVTVFYEMFRNCSSLTTILVGSGWTTAAATTNNNMFLNCTSLVGGMGTTYDANHVDAAYAHIDGGTANPGYLTEFKEAYACYTPGNTTLTFYYDGQRSAREGTTYDLNEGYNYPAWYNGSINANVTHVVFDPSFSSARPTTTCSWFYNMTNLTTITGMKEYLNTSEVTAMTDMFCNCLSLTSIDVSGFNTEGVTNMNGMFYRCNSLTSLDLSGFNTEGVTDMRFMFAGCEILASLDVSRFNTSNVTDMSYMFNYCWHLRSLDVSGFNTANVTRMAGMFLACFNLTSLNLSGFNTEGVTAMTDMFCNCLSLTSLDVSGFNTSNVTDMGSMFYGCTGLTSLDVSNFNTSKVTDMSSMFDNCSSLTSLDVSSFNTSKVTDMACMFRYCGNLKTIYADSGWSTAAVASSVNMFLNCTSLVGGMGTTYDANHVDAAYAHIDGGTSNPGYFTDKNAGLRGDVNGDGQVKIGDVTALINYLLSGDATGINLQAADTNNDGQIKIGDVTTLINYLLSGTW